MVVKREIGTLSLLLTAVGSIIGSGWLFGPFFSAQLAGPAAIIAWVLGGLLVTLVALTFAELSCAFPMTGGSVRYMQFSHGPIVGFAMAWISWVSSLAVAPVETLAILHYAEGYLPGMMHRVGDQSVLTARGLVVAGIILLTMCAVNTLGTQKLTKTNSFLTAFKILVPVIAMIALFSINFHTSNFVSAGFAPNGLQAIVSALPMAGIVFSFLGYSTPVQLAGEAKNPQRSLPISIIGALLLCTVLYVLLQIAFIGALSPSDFRAGWSHISFSGDFGPFAGIALGLGAIWLAKLLYVDAVISPYGTGLIYSGSTARLFYAMGHNGYVPRYFMVINKWGAPARIIALNFVLGLLLFMPFPTWQKMSGFLVSALVFSYAVGPLSLVVLRAKLPHYERPFRLPAAKIICFLAFYVCNLIIYWCGWTIVSKMLVAMALGYIVLFLFRDRKTPMNFQWRRSWWIFVYAIVLGILSYCGTFGGGKGWCPFGWDFLAVVVGSAVIYWLALQLGLSREDAEQELDRGKV